MLELSPSASGRRRRGAWRLRGELEAAIAAVGPPTGRGTLRAPAKLTLAEAAEEWLEAARAGIVRTRSGDRYKPSALRAYTQALRVHSLPELGHVRLSAVDRNRVQDLVDRLGRPAGSPPQPPGPPRARRKSRKPRAPRFSVMSVARGRAARATAEPSVAIPTASPGLGTPTTRRPTEPPDLVPTAGRRAGPARA